MNETFIVLKTNLKINNIQALNRNLIDLKRRTCVEVHVTKRNKQKVKFNWQK